MALFCIPCSCPSQFSCVRLPCHEDMASLVLQPSLWPDMMAYGQEIACALARCQCGRHDGKSSM